jgi:hypothetical protein
MRSFIALNNFCQWLLICAQGWFLSSGHKLSSIASTGAINCSLGISM